MGTREAETSPYITLHRGLVAWEPHFSRKAVDDGNGLRLLGGCTLLRRALNDWLIWVTKTFGIGWCKLGRSS